VWWPTELGTEANKSVRGFAIHALPCSIPFLFAWFVFGLARPDWFQSSRLTTKVLWGLVVAVFLAARVPARPYAALILPPLLTVCCLGLRRSARIEQGPCVLDILGRIHLLNVMTLALIRLTAIAVYAVCRTLNLHVPTNLGLYAITMPLGFWYFFRSLWVVFRSKSA
jgi:hypothetical protein